MKKTLREVRDFLNTLTEEQLDQTAMLAGVQDEYSGGNIFPSVLGDDWYEDEDGGFKKSDITDEEFQEYIANGGKIQWPKNSVFFYLDY